MSFKENIAQSEIESLKSRVCFTLATATTETFRHFYNDQSTWGISLSKQLYGYWAKALCSKLKDAGFLVGGPLLQLAQEAPDDVLVPESISEMINNQIEEIIVHRSVLGDKITNFFVTEEMIFTIF